MYDDQFDKEDIEEAVRAGIRETFQDPETIDEAIRNGIREAFLTALGYNIVSREKVVILILDAIKQGVYEAFRDGGLDVE